MFSYLFRAAKQRQRVGKQDPVSLRVIGVAPPGLDHFTWSDLLW
jgi:hypothetical protein